MWDINHRAFMQAYERFEGPDARGRVVVDIRHDGLHAGGSN